MGLRESINQNPAITTGATVAVILVALAFIFWNTFASDNSIPTSTADESKASTQALAPKVQP